LPSVKINEGTDSEKGGQKKSRKDTAALERSVSEDLAFSVYRLVLNVMNNFKMTEFATHLQYVPSHLLINGLRDGVNKLASTVYQNQISSNPLQGTSS